MINFWSNQHEESLLRLSPTTSIAIQAKRLAARDHWKNLGRNEAWAWGTTLDTGADTWLRFASIVQPVQLNCSCHNRKPCEPMLALLLLMLRQPEAFVESETTSSAVQTQMNRKLANRADILGEVSRGLRQLDQWLNNLIRNGLGEPQVRTYAFWDEIADQMWVARMPGLSQHLREIARLPILHEDWVELLLDQLGRLYLLVRSFDRFDQLPLETRADLCDAVGCRELMVDMPVMPLRDQWLVLGQRLKHLEIIQPSI